MFYERSMYKKYSRSTDREDLVSWEDYLRYRFDYYFSVTAWTKPLLLMSFAFVLIFISTCARTLFLREDFGSAAWSSWTFVADAGQIHKSESNVQ